MKKHQQKQEGKSVQTYCGGCQGMGFVGVFFLLLFFLLQLWPFLSIRKLFWNYPDFILLLFGRDS